MTCDCWDKGGRALFMFSTKSDTWEKVRASRIAVVEEKLGFVFLPSSCPVQPLVCFPFLLSGTGAIGLSSGDYLKYYVK